MKNDDFHTMVEQAEKALISVIGVKKNERVKVITDKESKEIGMAFHEASKRLGLSTVLLELPEKRPLKDMPEDLKNKIDGSDIFINAFQSSAEETPFRIQLITFELEKGAKVAHAPGISREMFINGPLKVDYKEMKKRAMKLMELMEGADTAIIKSKKGTDLKIKINGRKFQTDITIEEKQIGNLPAGEIWCAPHEDGADGMAVIDGTIGDLGYVPNPVIMHFSKGKVIKIECEDEEFRKKLEKLIYADEMSSVIGELGIGINENAKLIGNMLVDEKAAKTIHIALGNNLDFHGGKNNSSMHRDFLIIEPDLEIIYSDGSTRLIMKKGEIIL